MAIARVQSVVGDTGSSAALTSLTLTFGSPTTSGNVVIVSANISDLQVKVTSAHGAFYSATPCARTSGGSSADLIFWSIMTGADTAITVALVSGAAFVGAAVAVEYSGATIVPDAAPNAVTSTTSNANTGSVTNLTANALYVASIGQRTFNSTTENSAWASGNVQPFNIAGQTTTNINSGNADKSVVYLDAIVTTTAARIANVNSAFGSLVSAGVLATFKQITSGGGIRTAGHGGLAA